MEKRQGHSSEKILKWNCRDLKINWIEKEQQRKRPFNSLNVGEHLPGTVEGPGDTGMSKAACSPSSGDR